MGVKKEAKLDEAQIEELAAIGCTDDEIARIAGVSEATLKNRFREALSNGRARLKASIRRHQLRRAEEGSDTMLIWLGKVVLRQRPPDEREGREEVRIVIKDEDAKPSRGDERDDASR